MGPKFYARVSNRRGSQGAATNGGEAERVDLDTEGGDVLLLELASEMALDEGGLRKSAASMAQSRARFTFPVPPSPTRTSLKVGFCCCSAMVFE
jgi:hypothetical protein